MRLIDADALLESAGVFERWACARGAGKSIMHLAKAWLFNEVGKAPTIEAEPVKHGRWDAIGGIITCSECERSFNLLPVFTHYCPQCGAKMDLEETE